MMNQQQKPDTMDKLMDGGVVVGKSSWNILKQQVDQFKRRTFDDLGYFSRNLILTGGAIFVVSILLTIFGAIAGIKVIIGPTTTMLTSAISQLLVIGSGLISMGIAAMAVQKIEPSDQSIDQLPDIQEVDETDSTQDYEDALGNELDDLFSDADWEDTEDTEETVEPQNDSQNTSSYNWDTEEEDSKSYTPVHENIDSKEVIQNIKPNQLLTRHNLLESLLPLFPKNRQDFADVRDIDPSQQEFQDLELITVKAIANITNKQIEEVTTTLQSAEVGVFSYRLKFKRINSIKSESARNDLAQEFVNYMRQSPKDNQVQATVELDGDYFVVTISKGESGIIVTVGDILQKSDNYDYFDNEKHKLPVIIGMDDLGNVILDDAKDLHTCMIMGKPRSGKSWYVFNLLLTLMAFNSPEEIQFVIIDPKEQNLFNKLSYMPHVIGLHNDKKVLEIIDDIIEVEGERRKKLLKDNDCEDIWDLRKKGIQLPILYLVIDEVITVMHNLSEQDKEKEKAFNQKLKVLISELPYVGIRLMFIPHRATGLVDKTNRAMLQFVAAVRNDRAEIEEGLGIQKWYRSLTQPGDMAVKLQTRAGAFYARGPAIATQNKETEDVMVSLAKAFYKMGVKPSELRKTLTVAYNRDEVEIRRKLQSDGIIQYDATNVLKEDDLDRFSEDNYSDAYEQNRYPSEYNSGINRDFKQQRPADDIKVNTFDSGTNNLDDQDFDQFDNDEGFIDLDSGFDIDQEVPD